jgi:hypothetical protein
MKFYKVMALPIVLYGCETWSVKTKDINRIQATGMRYLISVKVCTTTDHVKRQVLEQSRIDSIQHQIECYRQNG